MQKYYLYSIIDYYLCRKNVENNFDSNDKISAEKNRERNVENMQKEIMRYELQYILAEKMQKIRTNVETR